MTFGLQPTSRHNCMADDSLAFTHKKMQTTRGKVGKEIPEILFLVRRDAELDDRISEIRV
jgi:hypothetical protein